mgnify:CR=1 FL=1
MWIILMGVMGMKKGIIWLLGIILIIALFMVYTNKYPKPMEKNHKARDKLTLRIAGDNNFPPYEFVDEKGEYKGFNIDIMRAIEETVHIEIELIPMRWTDAVSALERGQIDAIQGMAKIPSREEKYKFTQSTSINSSAIFVKKETDYIRNINDLKGARIAYQMGDINEVKILEIPYAIMIPRHNQVEGLEALLNNEADAFIGNKAVAIYRLNKMKAANKVKVLEEPFGEISYGPVTMPENLEVYNILDEGLRKIKDSGDYDKIYKKWFGDQLSPGRFNLRYYLKEIIIISLVIIIILLGFFLWNKKLQIEVAKRTKELKIANENLKSQQERIYNLAYYDTATGLPNRLYFTEKLENTIESLNENEILAVFYLDLDKFKHINATLGHKIGDKVLKLVGERLRTTIANNTLARASGDAYIILIKDVENEDEALQLAKKIVDDFKQPILVEDYKLYLTVSIGVAIYPEAGIDSISLIKNAEVALYKAKDMGGNNYFKYNEEMGKQEYLNLTTLNELREAVTNDEFILYYQPKIDIKTRKIIGMEALIRWKSPRKGLVFPDKFIPLAEDTGLIFPIGEWVIKEACRQNKEWIEKGYKPRRVSVNISARQFQHYKFLDTVSNALKETGLEPEYLGLEITETVAVSDIDHTINVLKELKELGVFVIMDDFGTGYSSLSYLKEMSIDEIKIDRTFISDMEISEKNRAISNTIIILAKQFNILVTAEGVESKEQLKILENMGCHKAQGYYFSKPIPNLEFEKLLD